jgi:anti-sigma factor RsiW
MPDTRLTPRLEGGLWCHEVLACLPDLVDGSLDPSTLAKVKAHLDRCDACTRFGGQYADTVQRVKAALSSAPEPEVDVRDRLRDRLRRELNRG